MTVETDRIRKVTVLSAPQERVWNAISDARQFGRWFGAEFDGAFVPGARVSGRIVPTTVDPAVAKLQEPYAGTAFEVFVERVEPMRLLSFRWHPSAVESDVSAEPTTLVEFELAATDEGTVLTITESGYDAIPLARRAAAFEANDGGWEHQLKLVAAFVSLQQ